MTPAHAPPWWDSRSGSTGIDLSQNNNEWRNCKKAMADVMGGLCVVRRTSQVVYAGLILG
eukprot:scaffold7003_cov60-Attheya_sp.AAC.3